MNFFLSFLQLTVSFSESLTEEFEYPSSSAVEDDPVSASLATSNSLLNSKNNPVGNFGE